jgi:hypothetical protein
MRRFALIVVAAAAAAIVITQAEAADLPAFPRAGLVTQDAPLRGAPRDSAPLQAQMGRGEALEIRAERGDHWQVWDYRRERGGWLRKAQMLVVPRGEGASAQLLAQLRLARQQFGTEGLGLGLAAAYVQAAPPGRWMRWARSPSALPTAPRSVTPGRPKARSPRSWTWRRATA